MDFTELQATIEHLKKTCKCPQCNGAYTDKGIHVITTTTIEGLLEMRCLKCNLSSLVTVLITPAIEQSTVEIKETHPRTHRGISDNDLLDIKNFLSRFDGDFKKIFNKFPNSTL